MVESDPVVIVGASLAGLSCAQELRREGYDGPIVMLGDEAHRPYDRPPLSKQLLTGEWDAQRVELSSAEQLRDHRIEHRAGSRAIRLDPDARVVSLDSGEHLRYSEVVIAVGVRARKLGLPTTDRVHTLRTLDDALRLRACLERSPRVVVVGGGFLGVEIVGSCRTIGLQVSHLHRGALPLERHLGEHIGRSVARCEDEAGVLRFPYADIETVSEGRDGLTLVLTDSTRIEADILVAAVGSVPDTGWLDSSGLAISDGVICDGRLRAAPHVWVAGDVARWPSARAGGCVRVEHRMNASEQGRVVAAGVIGRTTSFDPIPYMWSDLRYAADKVRIQVHGFASSKCSQRIIGEPSGQRFVVQYERAGKPIGYAGWNAHKEMLELRSRLE